LTAGQGGIRHGTAVLGTLLSAFIWGASFAAMKFSIQSELSVGAMLTLRFGIGALCLGLIMAWRGIPLRRAEVADGLRLGLLVTSIFWLQADGLRFTTTARSGFITGLYLLFTPAIGVLLGHRLRLAHGLGALAAAGGLYLLVHVPGGAGGGWGRGETETLACSFLCGLHIVFTGIFSRRSSGWVLAFTQVAMASLVSLAVTLLLPAPHGFQGAGVALARLDVWVSLLYLGFLATGLAFFLMMTLQAHLGATEAAILYSLEPVFTALLAMSGWVPGIKEDLGAEQLLGGAIILGAMLLAELGPRLLGRAVPAPGLPESIREQEA
jgi:drug/metabolite transporter (DMT)-like permease